MKYGITRDLKFLAIDDENKFGFCIPLETQLEFNESAETTMRRMLTTENRKMWETNGYNWYGSVSLQYPNCLIKKEF
jgi:hypothetical protein